jgi:hypothetical protein
MQFLRTDDSFFENRPDYSFTLIIGWLMTIKV